MECATVTCSRKRAPGPDFSSRAFQGTKWRTSSKNWVPVISSGRRDSGSVWAGTAARMAHVSRAGAEIVATAGI
jgi:hypothetical protein